MGDISLSHGGSRLQLEWRNGATQVTEAVAAIGPSRGGEGVTRGIDEGNSGARHGRANRGNAAQAGIGAKEAGHASTTRS